MDYSTGGAWAGLLTLIVSLGLNIHQRLSGKKHAEALVQETINKSLKAGGEASKAIAEAVVTISKENRERNADLKSQIEELSTRLQAVTAELQEVKELNRVLTIKLKNQDTLIIRYKNGKAAGIL